ncbi:reducing hydrogenase subunit alpha [Varibaculum vaginae]|uniref:reducing hydrogenase subunit alpha n=1 Tax=Varibaculum vaginae TaxID=2364797 RepID=UPI000F0854AA|nr:reducing hydrogenase subunit alpha [Varibaculum vaginae]
MKINLDEIIDPMEGRVVVTHDSAGRQQAYFDLQGLPRVDGMLLGKSAHEALKLTEHLCGICPVAHHLAGTRALDVLSSSSPISPVAELTRRLLHYGSLVETHSLRFLLQERDSGVALKKISKKILVAAGSPGHFPVTAIPGGVANWPKIENLKVVKEELPVALQVAKKLCEQGFKKYSQSNSLGEFTGAELALIDEDGNPDVFGTRVRVARQGKTVKDFDFSHWNEQIAEEKPGAAAPRPYLRGGDPSGGRYRVGPVAQLSVGTLPSELASSLQMRWLASNRDAASARAIITLHVLERTGEVVAQLLQILESDNLEPCPQMGQIRFLSGAATGLVDGPRGILAHTYATDSQGLISAATILTPTAQNEPWLAELLTQAINFQDVDRAKAMEQSIREADPCLPISSAPAGQMGLKVDNL